MTQATPTYANHEDDHEAKRAREEAIAADPQPGDVYYTSWGYDQTNSEYFEVVDRTKATVKVRRIAAMTHQGRLVPVTGEYVEDFQLGDETKTCRLRKVEGRHADPFYVGTSLTISQSRHAFPYGGGGTYDTRAAGQPGH